MLATSVASPVPTRAQLVINELMQSNIDCVMDDINEFPDSWVELYNSGTTALNLNTFSISDESDPTTAWPLPNKTLQPGSYILVYCDKEAQGLPTSHCLYQRRIYGTEHGHTLAEYDNWMDTMEFLNLMLVNLYYNNRDFPGNNTVMWRPRSEDGRWRWIMKDTDFGLVIDRAAIYMGDWLNERGTLRRQVLPGSPCQSFGQVAARGIYR